MGSMLVASGSSHILRGQDTMRKRCFETVGGEANWIPKSTCVLPPSLWVMLNECISNQLLYNKYPKPRSLNNKQELSCGFCRSGIWLLPEWFLLMWLLSGLSRGASAGLWLLEGLRSSLAIDERPPFLAMSLHRAAPSMEPGFSQSE